jgi:hypothetical protein
LNVQLVPCPTCGGTSQQVIEYPAYPLQMSGRFKKRTQRCLSCRKHPGQVEADRVCPTCRKFVDMCLCPRVRIVSVVKLSPDTESKKESPVSQELTGITYRERDKVFVASIYKDKKVHYLGSFKDKTLAEGIRLEAEHMPVSEFPALRANYRKVKLQGQIAETSQPATSAAISAITLDPAKQNVQDVLLDCIAKALQADETLRRLRLAAQAACDDAATAEQVAIDAWNVVIETLRDRAGADSALNRSALAQS